MNNKGMEFGNDALLSGSHVGDFRNTSSASRFLSAFWSLKKLALLTESHLPISSCNQDWMEVATSLRKRIIKLPTTIRVNIRPNGVWVRSENEKGQESNLGDRGR